MVVVDTLVVAVSGSGWHSWRGEGGGGGWCVW